MGDSKAPVDLRAPFIFINPHRATHVTGFHMTTLRRSIRRVFDLDYEPPADPPPKVNVGNVRIDHDLFHDLMHPVWSRYCASMPGGRFNHVRLWWHFRGSEAVMRFVFCPFGFHDYTRIWKMRDGEAYEDEVRCRNCGWLRGDHARSRNRPDHWRNR